LLGLAFLVAQAQLWATLWRAGFVPATSGYAAVFFALTGLHALHVLGGLAFLGFLVRGLGHDVHAPGVRLGAVYWHYMGVIWVVLFALLYWVR
jgi:cytochrome c oxidase subunit 3